jgi:hypothetical protein
MWITYATCGVYKDYRYAIGCAWRHQKLCQPFDLRCRPFAGQPSTLRVGYAQPVALATLVGLANWPNRANAKCTLHLLFESFCPGYVDMVTGVEEVWGKVPDFLVFGGFVEVNLY